MPIIHPSLFASCLIAFAGLAVACKVAADPSGSLSQDDQASPSASAGSDGPGADDDDDDDDDEADDDDDEGGPKFDIGDPPQGEDEDGPNGDPSLPGGGPGGDATIRGVVVAPNGELPISGALVYTAGATIDEIPEGAYCQDCVEFEPEINWKMTAPDGSFELHTASGDDITLVVQKGQFRQATRMDIEAGNSVVPADATTMPAEWNPAAGHWMPKMAVIRGQADAIENVLAKLGLGDVDDKGALVPGTEAFDFYRTRDEARALLGDLSRMLEYHIIFVPCLDVMENWGSVPAGWEENIREYARAGGKWYVTDWANEYIYEPFPEYQIFEGANISPDLGEYDSWGKVLDPDMLAWLVALPEDFKDPGQGLPTLFDLPRVELIDNWSAVIETPEILAPNENGNLVNIGHYTWVESTSEGPYVPNHMTITAPYECGKLLFSTYHTAETAHVGLAPQELMLLYLILEIGVCHEPIVPPG